eukprot:9000231-Pyramimonas_sp.AAC.1
MIPPLRDALLRLVVALAGPWGHQQKTAQDDQHRSPSRGSRPLRSHAAEQQALRRMSAEVSVTPAYLHYVCVAPPGATRAPRGLIVHASWRALSGRTARETIYYKMGIPYVRVGRAPPRRTYSI